MAEGNSVFSGMVSSSTPEDSLSFYRSLSLWEGTSLDTRNNRLTYESRPSTRSEEEAEVERNSCEVTSTCPAPNRPRCVDLMCNGVTSSNGGGGVGKSLLEP